MSKKVCLILLIISLATPISYASFVAFSPPKVIKTRIEYPKPANRNAYKPYSGGRSDRYMYDFDSNINNPHIRSVGNDFKRAGAAYNNDARDFDKIASAF